MSEAVLVSLKSNLLKMESDKEFDQLSDEFKNILYNAIRFSDQLSIELKELVGEYDKIKKELYELKRNPNITEK